MAKSNPHKVPSTSARAADNERQDEGAVMGTSLFICFTT